MTAQATLALGANTVIEQAQCVMTGWLPRLIKITTI